LEDKVGEMDFSSPFLSTKKGLFLFPRRGEVKKMDMESDMSEGDMRGMRMEARKIKREPQTEFHLPLLKTWTDPSERTRRF